MNARVALIVGSMLAAAVVAAPLAWFAVRLDSEPASSNAIWIAQLRLTLPAILAACSSAWWHSRKGRVVDSMQGTLSARIVFGSFPVFAAITTLLMSVDRWLFVEPGAVSGSDWMLGAASAFVMIMLASIVLFLPAFFLECAVVRLVCARCARSVSPGVVP